MEECDLNAKKNQTYLTNEENKNCFHKTYNFLHFKRFFWCSFSHFAHWVIHSFIDKPEKCIS